VHFAKFGECAEAADSFGGEIHIMGKMAGEIIGAKLVLRIETFSLEVVGPFLQHRPIWRAKIGVSFHLGQRGE